MQLLQEENKKLWGEVRHLTAQEPPAVPELQAPRVEQVVEQPSGSQMRGERWALPVDAHIGAALKENVKQKEAIDFSLLLEQNMFSPPKERGQVLLSESEWVQAWNVFQAMHGRYFPLEVAGLADHMRNVLKLQSQKGQWRNYDLKVRLAIQNGFLKWGKKVPHCSWRRCSLLESRGLEVGLGRKSSQRAFALPSTSRANARQENVRSSTFVFAAELNTLS
jgi:hypothetical protein